MQENSPIPIPMHSGRLCSTGNQNIVVDHPGEGKPDAEERDDSLVPGCSSESPEIQVLQGTKRKHGCLERQEESASPNLGFVSTRHLLSPLR
jgi:hypothetical protein